MPPSILIVDDESGARRVLEKAFRKRGYRTLTAENGLKALEIVRTEDVGLIVSDIVMPVMNGYELFQNVRNEPGTSHIPFIFESSKGSSEERVYGLNLGADDYVAKPVNLEEILLRVENILRRLENMEKPSLATVEMTGRFRQESISDIIQFFAYGERSGALEVRSESSSGKIWFQEGELFGAVLYDLAGEAAIFEMMCFQEGVFSFAESQDYPERNIHNSVMHVLLEGSRQQDERLHNERAAVERKRDSLKNAFLALVDDDYAVLLPRNVLADCEAAMARLDQLEVEKIVDTRDADNMMTDAERVLNETSAKLVEKRKEQAADTPPKKKY